MAKLIILCGLPGCGKSTYAENYKAVDDAIFEGNTVIHSSDAIRKELFGDECGLLWRMCCLANLDVQTRQHSLLEPPPEHT